MMRRNLGRKLWGTLATLFVLSGAPEANAYWTEPTDVIEGTAYNLREGELTIGIFSPLQYGVSDALTLRIHPVLGLFLTPNLGAQVELVEGPVTVALAGSYLQTFLNRDDRDGFPGRGEGGVVLSVPIHRTVIGTTYIGGGQQFRTLTSRNDTFLLKSVDGSVDFGTRKRIREVNSEEIQTEWIGSLGLNWIVGAHNQVAGKVRLSGEVTGSSSPEVEGTLQWTTAWDRFRFSAGFQVGDHELSLLGGEAVRWPVYPLIDIWLRI